MSGVNYMKYEGRLSFLNGLLSIMLIFTTLPLMAIIFQMFLGGNADIKNNILNMIVGLIILGGYFMIIFTLRKVIKSIRSKNPFNPDNILYFKRIGGYILMVGVIEAMLRYPTPNTTGLDILATSYGSLKPIFFLYLVLSILSYVLSDVFGMAMEIKDENDLTV